MTRHRCVSGMVMVTLALCAAAQADVITHQITHGGTTITMDFVYIGNAGNAADEDTGRGAVGYNYQIEKYEVTADQWNAVVAADPKVGDASTRTGSEAAGSINWYEAARFCNWLTTGDAKKGVYNTTTWKAMDHQEAARTFGRAYFIPTEDEWYKAAYYDPNKNGAGVAGYWDYPTKHDKPDAPDGIDFEGDPDFDAVFPDPYAQWSPNSVYKAGVPSAYGTIGQGGNVWEWDEATSGDWRTLRGGDYRNGLYWLRKDILEHLAPTNSGPNVGFRVAYVPEPASITLTLCGALAGLYWWRRRK